MPSGGQNTINQGPNSYSGKPYPYVHFYENGKWYITTAHSVLNGGR